jgi:quercetin dioxygenase-like cupin family protein
MSEADIRRVEGERRRANPDWFEGHVEAEAIIDLPGNDLRQGRVHFHDGAHTRWPLHVGDQVLYFVAGQGMAQNHDGTVIDCEPGDIVHVPPGTRHRHGARPGTSATHIAITCGETIWDADPRYPR